MIVFLPSFVGLLLIVAVLVLLLGVIGFGKILWFILIGGFVLIGFRLLPSCSVILLLLPGVLVFLRTLLVLIKNSAKLGFPTFAALGKGRPALMNSNSECDGWLPRLGEFSLPALTGDMLFEVVKRKSATAGSSDGVGVSLRCYLLLGFDGLARILYKVEDLGVWPDGLLDAYIAMIPKVDGDATPLDQLPVVYRVWASARMLQLEPWFRSWVPSCVF